MDATFHGYSKATLLRSGGKAPLREALLETRARTLELADAYAVALAPHGLQVPYAAERNPPLWEWGHIAWFQEWWIARNRQRALGVHGDPLHDREPSLLPHADAWYDSSRVEHRSRWTLPMPSEAATREYLAATLDQTLNLLDRLAPDASPKELYFYRLVALHEAMHAEAAVYMGRSLGVALPQPGPVARTKGPALSPLFVPAQVLRIGSGEEGFAFDNELAAHDVSLEAFEIDAQPVTWGRFLGFADAGGYRQPQWWSDAGWDWQQRQGGSVRELPDTCDADSPAVHLTAYEAEAWCRWAGRRLPTEAEWECAAVTKPGFAWGEVWEWTGSDFLPYRGFQPHPYRDYSQPWFGGRRVLRGASHATSPWLAHPRYRNFFEPQRADVFAGFRSCA